MPAFVIALVITAILAIAFKESARFNSTIVVIKVSVVLFVIGLGFRYVERQSAGWRLAYLLRPWVLRHRRRTTYTFLRISD